MKHSLLPLLALLAPACSTPSHPEGPLTEFEFLAGTWRVEVHGWLVTDPQPYTGHISVTYAGRPHLSR